MKTDKIGLMFKCLTFLAYTHMTFQGASFLAIRKNPHFVYSLFWEIRQSDNVCLLIVCVVFEVLVVFYSWCGTLDIGAGILFFPSIAHNWNDYIR